MRILIFEAREQKSDRRRGSVIYLFVVVSLNLIIIYFKNDNCTKVFYLDSARPLSLSLSWTPIRFPNHHHLMIIYLIGQRRLIPALARAMVYMMYK